MSEFKGKASGIIANLRDRVKTTMTEISSERKQFDSRMSVIEGGCKDTNKMIDELDALLAKHRTRTGHEQNEGGEGSTPQQFDCSANGLKAAGAFMRSLHKPVFMGIAVDSGIVEGPNGERAFVGNADDEFALWSVQQSYRQVPFNTYGAKCMDQIPDRWVQGQVNLASSWLIRMGYELENPALNEIVNFANNQWKAFCLAVINGGRVDADRRFKAHFKDSTFGVIAAKQYLKDSGVDAHTAGGVLHKANELWEAFKAEAAAAQ